MTRHTSRRALLRGAAMLTAVPVAALGGVPVFDVVEDLMPSPGGIDLSTLEGRIAALCQWFDLEPPVLAYDPEDIAGGPLLTDKLDVRLGRVVQLAYLGLAREHGGGPARRADAAAALHAGHQPFGRDRAAPPPRRHEGGREGRGARSRWGW